MTTITNITKDAIFFARCKYVMAEELVESFIEYNYGDTDKIDSICDIVDATKSRLTSTISAVLELEIGAIIDDSDIGLDSVAYEGFDGTSIKMYIEELAEEIVANPLIPCLEICCEINEFLTDLEGRV